MSASAMVLPRRPPTLVGLRPMRPQAPTIPVDEPETLAVPTREDFDDVTERRDEQDVTLDEVDDEDEATHRRAKLAHALGAPGAPVSTSDDDVTKRRFEPTLDEIEIIAELRSGIIESSTRTPRVQPSVGPATARLESRHTDTVRREDEHTRVDTPRARIVPLTPPPVAMRPEPTPSHGFAHAPTLLVAPTGNVRAVSGTTRIATPAAHTPSGVYAAPYAASSFPPAGPPPAFAPVHAWAAAPHPAFAATIAVTTTPSTVPAPLPTVRRAPVKRRGSRFATFACGLVAVSMATVALAESPLGARPEVAPYAKVVRRESRSALHHVATGAKATWARLRAR